MFLAPIFLIGLLAAAIPLILHLRRSTRHRKIVFSTTRFFDEQFIRSARRAQVQDKLLMFLRIALLALFVLALAQPLVRLPGFSRLLEGRQNVALVIDDSASMAMGVEGGTALEAAKRHAAAALDGLSEARGDRVTVVLAGRRDGGPAVLFPEPTGDLEAVRRAIESIGPTDLGADVQAAAARGAAILGMTSHGGATHVAGGRVMIFSDLQASAFVPGQHFADGPGMQLAFVDVGPDREAARQNVSVDALQYGAPQPMQNVPFTFRALLSNHAPRERSVTASLVIDGQTVSQRSVELPPGRRKLVRFTHRFTEPGWFGGYVEVGPDPADASAGSFAGESLAADNRRYFALRVEHQIKLLAVNGAPSAVPISDELFFFRLALTVNPEAGRSPRSGGVTGGAIELDEVAPSALTPQRLSPNQYPLVVLANVAGLEPEALEALERYVDAGGNLLITLGDRVDPAAYGGWVGPNRLHGGLLPGRIGTLIAAAPGAESPPPGATQDAGFIATVADDHPVVAGFSDGQFGSLSAVRFTARYRLEAAPDEVLMRSPEGDPLMAEKRFGRGRVVLFASSIDRDWTNFPLQPAYVPWLYRLVGYLAQGGADNAGFVRTGQVVRLPTSATQLEALHIELPGGGLAYPEPARGDPAGFAASGPAPLVLAQTERAGIYAVRPAHAARNAEPRLLLAANIPGDESDPTYLDKEALGALMPPSLAAGGWDLIRPGGAALDAAQLAGGRLGVWDALLLLALAVGLFEPWLANRLSRRRAAAAPDAMSQRDVATPTRREEVRPAA